MDFDLSEEQQLLQDTVRQFALNECPPTRVRELFDAEDGFDPVVWKGLVELGVGGINLPEEHGGAGLGLLDLAVVVESLGHAAVPAPVFSHALAGMAVALAGSDDQKARWLPALATGDLLGSVALGEGSHAWQPDQWTLAAGERLSGEKHHVPFGAHADLLVVGTAGGGLAVVERTADGVKLESADPVDRTRPTWHLGLDDAAAETLPGGAGVSGRLRDAALVLLAADAFGGASRLVEMSVEYAKHREQFGVTIGHFQALKHQLANMAIEIEPSRGLYWYAAHAFDHLPEEAERSAALAKAHITDRFLSVARDAVEAHGGIGFTWECDVQIWFKRAMFDRAFLGTPAVHRERAARLAGW
ncbi:MAG: acyl-CoA dehydrogenase family protein [Myxococcota bacterium]